MSYHIEAVTVNHNASSYVELILCSLFARHSSDLDISVTVFDNVSEDDATGLRAYAEKMGVSIEVGLDDGNGEQLSRRDAAPGVGRTEYY